jgi:hypothetical protein
VAALSTSEAELDLVSQEWWTGRLLLVVLSLSMQKIPLLVVLGAFKVEHIAQLAQGTHGRRTIGSRKRGCYLPRVFTVVPWLTWGACVIGSFLVTGVLTSKGLLGSNEFDETGTVPCKCRGIAAGKDVEMDWLLLICMTMVFKWFLYQPVILLVATCLHLCSANKLAVKMAVYGRVASRGSSNRGGGAGEAGQFQMGGVSNPMRGSIGIDSDGMKEKKATGRMKPGTSSAGAQVSPEVGPGKGDVGHGDGEDDLTGTDDIDICVGEANDVIGAIGAVGASSNAARENRSKGDYLAQFNVSLSASRQGSLVR